MGPRHPIVIATALAAVLHLLWAVYLAKDSGDMAAQYAWTNFIRAHPSASYNLSWYGGIHPASYSILSPYIMATLGVRTTAVIAGTLSTTTAAALLLRSGVKRPLLPVLWTVFALWCDVISGRVTFALGMLFALVCTALLFPAERAARGHSSRLAAATALAALATMCSPVAGLFLLVVAAALFLNKRRRDAYILAAAPPVVVGATSLLFPFYGVQPFKWYFAIIPLAVSAVIAVAVPKSWRSVHLGASVYAVGVMLTWVVPSPIGSNVERLALLFGGTVLLMVAMGSSWGTRRTIAVWLAFAGVAAWQITKPIVDQVTTAVVASTVKHAGPLISELRDVRADRGRVEVVPLRSHWEATGLSPYVNLARGWNRQADVERNPLFYDGTLTSDTYRDWLRRWSVNYVVLPTDRPDSAAVAEAKLVAAGQPWLHPIWEDANWRLYEVSGAEPLAEPPAVVEEAGPAELTVSMPRAGSVLLRIPWSPVLGIEGATDSKHGCVTSDGDWTRLYAPAAGRYRIGGSYALIRGTQCDKQEVKDGDGSSAPPGG
ncbi:MFS transporter [Actinacidiphila sp. ITFR-21]|uniref:MFS transporter n=1 Tax=Actinacidiphila sp. ITFR-21 TaxID=3075199 RepID=UPI00288A8E32|nr:MFS transporter [Streptomyces sp. ITFR-21]WNI18608.1 MFS transporter [Streptomyces sp. ITFR-21]